MTLQLRDESRKAVVATARPTGARAGATRFVLPRTLDG